MQLLNQGEKFIVHHLQLFKMNYYYFTNARLFMGILITMLLFTAYNLLRMNYEAKEEVRLRLVEMLSLLGQVIWSDDVDALIATKNANQ